MNKSRVCREVRLDFPCKILAIEIVNTKSPRHNQLSHAVVHSEWLFLPIIQSFACYLMCFHLSSGSALQIQQPAIDVSNIGEISQNVFLEVKSYFGSNFLFVSLSIHSCAIDIAGLLYCHKNIKQLMCATNTARVSIDNGIAVYALRAISSRSSSYC